MKYKTNLQYGLLKIIVDLFTPKHSFEFTASSSLSQCKVCIKQAAQISPAIDSSVYKVTVDVNDFPPNIAEFSIRIQQTGRYGFWRNISGYFETLHTGDTLVRGESNESGFIRRMIPSVFLVLLGLANDKISVVILLSLCGFFYGPLFTLFIKHRHVQYLKTLLQCSDS